MKEIDQEKNKFMEAVHSVQEIMKTSDFELTKEAVAAYFKNMNLSSQQQEMVYEYLQRPQKGTDSTILENIVSGSEVAEEQKVDIETELPDTAFFRLYLEELQQIPQCTEEEEESLYEQLIKGDALSVQKLSKHWMHRVLQIAKKQVAGIDPGDIADIIQEGNVGIFLALQQMLGSGKKMDFEKKLINAAENAMDEYKKKIAADTEMDQSLLAKAALVYEAQKFLADQLQRIPSAKELGQFTKLTETEIEDIMAILKEKK